MLTVDNQPADWLTIAVTVACMVVGTSAMAAGVGGFFVRRIALWQRALLVAIGLLVFFTRNTGTQWWLQIAAVALLVAWFVFEFFQTKGKVGSDPIEEPAASSLS